MCHLGEGRGKGKDTTVRKRGEQQAANPQKLGRKGKYLKALTLKANSTSSRLNGGV